MALHSYLFEPVAQLIMIILSQTALTLVNWLKMYSQWCTKLPLLSQFGLCFKTYLTYRCNTYFIWDIMATCQHPQVSMNVIKKQTHNTHYHPWSIKPQLKLLPSWSLECLNFIIFGRDSVTHWVLKFLRD